MDSRLSWPSPDMIWLARYAGGPAQRRPTTKTISKSRLQQRSPASATPFAIVRRTSFHSADLANTNRENEVRPTAKV